MGKTPERRAADGGPLPWYLRWWFYYGTQVVLVFLLSYWLHNRDW